MTRKLNRKYSLSVLSLLLLCLVPALAVGQVYTVTDLGRLAPTAINFWDQVVGNLNGHAFMWTKSGGLKNLGTLPNGSSSSAAAINDLGAVVGVADGSATVVSPNGHVYTCADVPQGFVWTSKNGMQGFGLILVGEANPCEEPGTSIVSYATGINIFGQVVGTINWGSNTYVLGFLWTQSGGIVPLPFSDLGFIIDNSEANGINNYGQSVGAVGCCVTLEYGNAVFWNSNGMVDLGTLGASDSFSDFHDYCSDARAINDLDQIVGWSTTVPSSTESSAPCLSAQLNSPHAFVWSQGQGMQDLGTLPGDTMSMAYANNFFGQIIGTSGNGVISSPYAGDPLGITVVGEPFIWTKNGGMKDLNTMIPKDSRWVLNTATGINIWGQIVGSGTRNGKPHGFLLTPR